ncbi:MAG: sulfotransferase [Bacteroidota bacterium]
MAGYGWSGSTLLERLLAAHPAIMACGEIHNFRKDFAIREQCSCGKIVDACPLWGSAYRAGKDLTDVELIKHLQAAAPPGTHYLTDASKTTYGTATRPWRLRSTFDLFLLHLVRNGEHCLNSNLHRKYANASPWKRRWKASLQGLHWTMAHLSALRFGRQHPHRYHKIHYEHLMENPKDALQSVLQWLELEPTLLLDILEKNANIPLGHQLSGNAIRFQENLQIDPSIRRPIRLREAEVRTFRFTAGPMMRYLGYGEDRNH